MIRKHCKQNNQNRNKFFFFLLHYLLITDIHCRCFNKCLLISSIVIALLTIGVITTVVVISLVKAETKRKVTTTGRMKTFLFIYIIIYCYGKLVVLRWNTTGITIIGVSGISGNTSNLLFEPWDLAMDWSNAIYVTEIRNNRVQKFSLNSKTGITVAGLANLTGCSSLKCLKSPLGIIVDDNKNLYISDRDNDRVVYWSNGASIGTLYAGTGSTSLTALDEPYGLAHDSSSNKIYIADFSNHRIVHRSSTNSSINVIVAGGNGNGTNGSQLLLPNAIHYDAFMKSLLIVNTGSHNVVRWTLGANNWTLAGGGTTGAGSTPFHLKSPTDVTLDPMGNMYVVDRNNHRIQFFSSGQLNGTTIAGVTGVSGDNTTLFNFPASMILDNQLNLYVVDRYNHRVQKFIRY